MKKNIHPENYRLVAFKDISSGDWFFSRSTVKTKDTIKIEDMDYPLYKLEISSKSHPFFTGKIKFVDTEGRIEKFLKKYKK
ncbi:MAG TPA: type B 50S ribosomal protein L31 [Candidatus Angelobacter sp.]|jgi:large subunit ribosomal protein L31|nr:type B 50S ribosomal protein L31 [Candidatus Angelobacter sp.]